MVCIREQVPKTHRIGVVGGGPAGVAFCLQLFDKLEARSVPVEVFLFERSAQIGPGLAYGKQSECAEEHLLNIPKDGMGPFVGRYGEFSDWLDRQQNGYSDRLFPPRHLFGQYLAHLAEQLRHKSATHSCVKVHFLTQSTVNDINEVRKGDAPEYRILYSEKSEKHSECCIAVDRVVLCIGHMPVHSYRHFIGLPGYGHDPTSYNEQFGAMDSDECVGIVGSKLCACDVALELRARGHRGPIWMGSRTGMLPAVAAPLRVSAVERAPKWWQVAFDSAREFAKLAQIGPKRHLHLKYVGKAPEKLEEAEGQQSIVPNAGRLVFFTGTVQGALSGPEQQLAIPLCANAKMVRSLLQMADTCASPTLSEIAECFFAGLADFYRSEHNHIDSVPRLLHFLRSLSPVQWLDAEMARCRSGRVIPWQLVLFSLYPVLPELWRQMSHADKSKYVRQWSSLLTCFYTAMPAENASKVREMCQKGQLRVIGDLDEVQWDQQNRCFEMRGKAQGQTEVVVRTKFLFNATGTGKVASNVPLIARLIRNGLVQEHPFGGICVSEDSMRVQGKRHGELFAIGELTQGNFLTTASMTKVAEQADKLSKRIAQQLTEQNGGPGEAIRRKEQLNGSGKEYT